MVLMNDGSTLTDNLTFNNALRDKSYANNQFYRSTQNEELDRLWINLSNEDGLSERTLIGYLNEATDLKDPLYDAITTVENGMQKIYSFFENDKLAIQAFGLPFSLDHIIPIGVNIPNEGNYYISIHAVEGLFMNQDIYVKDLLLNTINNISESPYIFYSEAGEVNNRFALVFHDAPLSIDENDGISNVISITGEHSIEVQSSKEMLKEISVYDLLGRRIIKAQNIDSTYLEVNSISKSNSVLLFKIVLNNQQVIYRKVLF